MDVQSFRGKVFIISNYWYLKIYLIFASLLSHRRNMCEYEIELMPKCTTFASGRNI